ncbi:T9SS type A sorting domain-containing protein [Flammeovirgaceae bacterium SG7u.111]|nr:T9SS type A sorting domain-containing protein [Flammeovirgaceae bacterium SG7u.132]WPO33664.1 T9SS type A sorting domain-containing protein [Flammeovirgaceae bacterium SG7u.111]
MKNYLYISSLSFLLFLSFSAWASSEDSVKVDINFDLRHEVGNISTFDRNKFITIHSNITEQEWDGDNFTPDLRDNFLNGYDAYLGRDTGGISWWLNAMVKEDPNRPGYADSVDIATFGQNVRNTYASKTQYHSYESRNGQIICAQLHPFWPDGQTTKNGWAFSQADTQDEPFGTATGEYMGRFIKEFFGTGGTTGQGRPNYVEIINEPLWHLVDYGTDSPEKIFKFHNAVAKEIRKYNKDLVIGGYCTAFPNHDEDNFKEWENRWKLFMDIAGENMDFWTIHLYDFPAFGGTQQYRKGSNMEATFDMMEQYSFMKFDEVKPFMVSEYGAQMHDYRKQWTPFRDWLFVKSVNSMMMQFMERPNIINKTIPFIPLKAEWGRDADGTAYNNRLLRKANELPGQTGEHYVYTEYIKIFELWSDVKGTRVDSYATNLDIMTDAYVDGKKAYVILNNLKFEPVNISLNHFGFSGNSLEKVEMKHVYLEGQVPVLKKEEFASAPQGVTLESEGTIVLAYTFNQEVKIDQLSKEVKHYADAYYKPISAGVSEVFNINGVEVAEHEEAVLRLGIGRDHGSSLRPTVMFNGTILEIPENYRGDVQKDRPRFFGVLEIPVPADLLQKNNSISVSFWDNGGHISSVALRHYAFSREVERSANSPVTGLGDDMGFEKSMLLYPNPVSGTLHIEVDSKAIGSKYYIVNSVGGDVKMGTISQQFVPINIKSLPAGVYVLKLGNNSTSLGKKFVVQ